MWDGVCDVVMVWCVVLVLVLVPLVVQMRGAQVWQLFGAAAVVYGAVVLAAAAQVWWVLRQAEAGRPAQYYAVFSGGDKAPLFALAMVGFGLIYWWLGRRHAGPQERRVVVLFWVLHGAFLVQGVGFGLFAKLLATPPRYEDFPAYAEKLMTLMLSGQLVALVAALGLIFCAVWPLLRR